MVDVEPNERRGTLTFASLIDQGRRARLFLDSYGASRGLRENTVAMLVPRLQWLIDHMRSAADGGDEAFAEHIADGHADLYLRDIHHIQAHAQLWELVIINDRASE